MTETNGKTAREGSDFVESCVQIKEFEFSSRNKDNLLEDSQKEATCFKFFHKITRILESCVENGLEGDKNSSRKIR